MDTLVTKLKATVNNPILPKLGVLPIYFDTVETPTAIGQGFTLMTTSNTLLKIENGNLTSSNLTDNLGTEATLNDVGTVRYVSNGATANVMNKYNLQKIVLRGGNLNNSNRNQVKHIRMNINELEYSPVTLVQATNTSCYGDIEKAFGRNTVCQYVELDETNIVGDVSVFSDKNTLIRLYLQDNNGIYGDVSGVISLPSLTELKVKGVEGNVNNVSSSSLKVLYMQASQITGNITFLNNLTALTTVEMYACTELEGSIEDIYLPSTCTKMLFRSNNKITGSIATFRTHNPNCTNVDFAGCSNVTA
jgi:hypothetical protein